MYTKYDHIDIFVNDILVWKAKNWKEALQIEKEQKEYHKYDKVPVNVVCKEVKLS